MIESVDFKIISRLLMDFGENAFTAQGDLKE